MGTSEIIKVRNVICPNCGSDGRLLVRTATTRLSRCYRCDDEATSPAMPGPTWLTATGG